LPEIIVNTSPLQYLHQVGLLELLPKLFGRVTVPGAVVRELAAGRRVGLDLPVPEKLAWVEVCEPPSPAGVLLAWDLGAGESASLSLALERPGAWVLLDDRLARAAAASCKLPILGTAGILLRAKRKGHLPAIRPVLDRLTALGFCLSQNTQEIILRLAGE
jgi:predicted nucleic acid-binding protein